jgi:hypothetical protein
MNYKTKIAFSYKNHPQKTAFSYKFGVKKTAFSDENLSHSNCNARKHSLSSHKTCIFVASNHKILKS